MSEEKRPACPNCRRELTSLMGQYHDGTWWFCCGSCQGPLTLEQATTALPKEVRRITAHKPTA